MMFKSIRILFLIDNGFKNKDIIKELNIMQSYFYKVVNKYKNLDLIKRSSHGYLVMTNKGKVMLNNYRKELGLETRKIK